MEIHVNNVIGSCDGFVSSDPSHFVEKSRQIVISPLKVTIGDNKTFDKTLRIVNGCNFGENCMNPDCWFGAIIREKKRAEAKIRKENHDD